jgi:uncharacterized protein (DUF58 family)
VLRIAWITLRALSALNHWLQRRLTLAGALLAALLVSAAVLGIDTERSMTYQLFTLALACFAVACAFAWRSRPQCDVERQLPAFATAGLACRYLLRVSNPGARAVAQLRIVDELADRRPGLQEFLRAGAPPAARSFIERHSGYARWQWLVHRRGDVQITPVIAQRIDPNETAELVTQLLAVNRGVVHFDALWLAREDPLGLIRAGKVKAAPQSLYVLPRRYRLPAFRLPGARRFQQGGFALAASVGDSEEFLALREYRPGDPLKRVHWRSFARLGKPVVKEYQDEFFERHALVLDTLSGASRDVAFEEAVAVAASFVCAIDTHECLLDLIYFGEQAVSVSAGRGMFGMRRLLEHLAVVQSDGERPFAGLANAVLSRGAELTSVIVVLTQWDGAREAFCERLRGLGIALTAYVVLQPGEQLEHAPAWLTPLAHGRIEQDLQRGL